MSLALFGALSRLEISARPSRYLWAGKSLVSRFERFAGGPMRLLALLARHGRLALLLLTALRVIALLLLSSLFQLLFFLPVHGLSCVLPSLEPTPRCPPRFRWRESAA